MGKFKQYIEPENVQYREMSRKTTGTAAPSKNRVRRAAHAPLLTQGQTLEALPLGTLFKLMVLRLRRTWLAFRFQAKRYTFGLSERKDALKMATLGAVAWFLFLYPGMDTVDETGRGKAMGVSLNWWDDKPNRRAKERLPSNEAAPVGANQLTEEMALDYIERFHDIAEGEMQKYGIPASISLAQGLVESRAGDSKLARRNNNHFGIKCFSRRCKKGHCSNFTDDTHKDFFRVFASPWESWRAHSQMLASGRYTKLKRYGRDYRQWAYGLKAAGYATDRTYAEKLIGIIERYELYRFDH